MEGPHLGGKVERSLPEVMGYLFRLTAVVRCFLVQRFETSVTRHHFKATVTPQGAS